MAEQVSFERWWEGQIPRSCLSVCRDAWHHQQLTIDAQAKQIAELEAKVKDLEEGRSLQQTRDVLRAMAPSKIPFIGTTGL